MALETLSYHKDIKITQVQTNVRYFYLNALLQVKVSVIFEAFSYILLNGSKRNAIIVTYVNHKQRLRCLWKKIIMKKLCGKMPNTVATLGYKYLRIPTGKFSCVTLNFNDR